MTAVIGLDLSLRHTGIAEADGTVRKLDTKTTGAQRLIEIRNVVQDLALRAWKIGALDLVVMEGYSYGSPAQAHPIGELGGVIRVALHELAIDTAIVPPTTLKKYATGKGNAGKYEVMQAASQRLGYQGHDDNEADALWLRAIGYDLLDEPLVRMPAVNRSALKAVTL